MRFTLRFLSWAVFSLIGALLLFSVLCFGVASAMKYPVLRGDGRGEPLIQGAYHVHSTASDGRGTRKQIAAAAAEAGLQFVILTDHNLEVLAPPEFIDGVLVITGTEESTPAGHLTALHLPRGLTKPERAKEPISTIASLGGFSFLSHPVQKKRPWTDWAAAHGATGLELYSLDSAFRDAYRRPISLFLPAIASYLGNPLHGIISVIDDPADTRARLLQLGDGDAKVALCAHDAHGRPSYENEFRAMAVAVPMPEGKLAADPAVASETIASALGRGAAYCVFRAIGEGAGFAIDGLNAARRASVGNILRVRLPPWAPQNVRLRVHGPARVIGDGRSIILERPGGVQLEVWIQVPGLFWTSSWRPWIVPSPIQVH